MPRTKKKTPATNRPASIQTRALPMKVPGEMYDAILEEAQKQGYATISEWLRDAIAAQLDTSKFSPAVRRRLHPLRPASKAG
jgi:hypothetical protein